MSIQTQITRLIQAKGDLIAQIEAKGVTVPADASLDDLAALVAAITGGEDLDEVLGEQDSLIAQIITALEGKAAGGIAPTGTLLITANGTYDVTEYASAEVDVEAGETETWTFTMEDGSTVEKDVVVA